MQGSKEQFFDRILSYKSKAHVWNPFERNQTCSYGEIWVWISRWINSNSTFWKFWSIKVLIQRFEKHFSIKSPTAGVVSRMRTWWKNFSLLLRRKKFKSRDDSILRANFETFQLSKFSTKNRDKWFSDGYMLNKCKTFDWELDRITEKHEFENGD